MPVKKKPYCSFHKLEFIRHRKKRSMKKKIDGKCCFFAMCCGFY